MAASFRLSFPLSDMRISKCQNYIDFRPRATADGNYTQRKTQLARRLLGGVSGSFSN
jgi:hypothetical protein